MLDLLRGFMEAANLVGFIVVWFTTALFVVLLVINFWKAWRWRNEE